MKMYEINNVDIIDLTQYRRFRLDYRGYGKYYIVGYLKNPPSGRTSEIEEWEFKSSAAETLARKTYDEIVTLLTK